VTEVKNPVVKKSAKKIEKSYISVYVPKSLKAKVIKMAKLGRQSTSAYVEMLLDANVSVNNLTNGKQK